MFFTIYPHPGGYNFRDKEDEMIYVLTGLGLLMMGGLWLSGAISIRRHNLKEKEKIVMVQSMGLKQFDPIIITFTNGDSRYAGFNYLSIDKKMQKNHIPWCIPGTSHLAWFIPGTIMSGGGWDAKSDLVSIEKIERAEHCPGVIW